jgi:O-antigen/teichoic acid export membrane protein
VLRNIGSNIVGTILPSLAALAAVPLLLSYLGIERFGIFSMQVAALFFFGLADFGIARAIVLLSFEPGSASEPAWVRPYRIGLRYSAMLAAVVAFGGLVAGAVLWVWHPSKVDPVDLSLSSVVIFASAAVMLVSQPPRAVLEARQQFLLANLIRGPAAAAIFLAPLTALASGNSTLTSASIAIFITRVVAAACYFRCCRTTAIAPSPHEEARVLRRAFLRKAGWLGMTNILSMLIGYADRFILAPMTSAAAVGQYAIAQEVVSKLWIASGAVISAGTPRLASHRGESAPLRRTGRQLAYAMWGMGVLPAAILIVFGGPLLRLWLRGNFDPAMVVPLQVMALGIGVNNLNQINFALLQVHGGEHRGAFLQVFHVLFLAIALLLLVPRFGINGAAVAFTVRLLIDAFLVRHLLRSTSREAADAGVGLGTLAACAALLGVLLASRWNY